MLFERLDIAQLPHLDDATVFTSKLCSSHPRNLTTSWKVSEQGPSVSSSKSHPAKGFAALHNHRMDFAMVIVQGIANRSHHPRESMMAHTIHSNGTVETKSFAANLRNEFQVSSVPNIGNEFLDQLPCFCIAFCLVFEIFTGIGGIV